MGIIAWIIMGLVVGAIAKMIMKSGGGWLSTLLIGIAGAVVGGWIGDIFGGSGRMSLFSIWSWILAVVGSLIVLWLYNAITGRRASR